MRNLIVRVLYSWKVAHDYLFYLTTTIDLNLDSLPLDSITSLSPPTCFPATRPAATVLPLFRLLDYRPSQDVFAEPAACANLNLLDKSYSQAVSLRTRR